MVSTEVTILWSSDTGHKASATINDAAIMEDVKYACKTSKGTSAEEWTTGAEIGVRLYMVAWEDFLTNTVVAEETEVWPFDGDAASTELGGDNSISIPSFVSADPPTHATDAVVGDKTLCKDGLGTL